MTTKTATHTVETPDTPAPGGQDAVKVTCLCQVCAGRGIAALVRKAYADEHNLSRQNKTAYAHAHNLVQMANSPLAAAPQVKANGPWAA